MEKPQYSCELQQLVLSLPHRIQFYLWRTLKKDF